MEEWFTVEKIDDDTFVISEYKHWEESHSYLLLGKEKALLIDTGLGVSNIKNQVDKITTLSITVATTHVHWDHIGGHKYFNNILVHEFEKEWLKKFPLPIDVVKNNLLKEKCDFPKDFNIKNFSVYSGNPNTILHDSDIINLGKRRIKVIHTPGHLPGYLCFYDEGKKYLFSGDLIYEGKLDAYYPSTNPKKFKDSVNKINTLNIKKILPGHHNLSIGVDLLEKISTAFDKLEQTGNLRQGNGIYKYDKFSIHI